MSEVERVHVSAVVGAAGLQIGRTHVSAVVGAAGLQIGRTHVSVVLSEIEPVPVTEPVNAFVIPS